MPSTAVTGLGFGYSVAIDAAGNTMLVGAPRFNSTLPGMVFVYRFDGTNWIEEWRSDGRDPDHFGLSVAMSAAGDLIAVGAPGRRYQTNWQDYVGAVDLFRRQGPNWVHEITLRASDWSSGDNFGSRITMSADGQYVFARSANLAGPPSRGAIYVFERTGNTWTEQGKLLSPVPYTGSGFTGFGYSLSVDATASTLVTGDPYDSRITYLQGAAFVFKRDMAGWSYTATVLPSSPSLDGNFGWCVRMNAAGDRFQVGIPFQELNGVSVGGVEEFELAPAGWASVSTHFSPTPEYAGFFGASLATTPSGRRWITGETSSDAYGTNAGRAHVFDAACLTPVTYCTAQTSSTGCVAQIGVQGSPSLSSPSGFTISATGARNQQFGLLFYGTNGRAALPWNGGTLCVEPPLHRTPLVNAGGSALPVVDCTGALTRDFNAWSYSAGDPILFAGAHVRAQFYGRDPAALYHVNLTDAVEFYLEP